MITYEEAKNKIIENNKDGKILNAFETKCYFVFVMAPKGWKPKNDDDYITDSFFAINKENSEICSYKPWMDPDYNNAKYIKV